MSKVNRVQYWLKDWNDKYMQFPVNPVGISIPSEYETKVIDVLALGQISRVENVKLATFEIEVLFPLHYHPSFCDTTDVKPPAYYVNTIERWRVHRRQVRFIVTDTPISIPVYIEKVEYEYEKAGMPGDVTAKISFVEAVAPRTPRMATRDKKGVLQPFKVRPSENPKKKPSSYVFQKKDTLYGIALRFYGNGGKLVDIYNANKHLFPKGIASKPIGERLRLP